MSFSHILLKFRQIKHRPVILAFFLPLTLASLQAQSLNPLLVPDLQADSRYGQSVELSGNTALITAPYQTVNDQSRQGALYVFHKTIDWDYTGAYFAPDGAALDKFGTSISSHGDRIAVGAPGNSSGAVYIYNNLQGSLTHIQTVRPHLEVDSYSNQMEFGAVVDITDKYLFISAPGYQKSPSEEEESVFIYEHTPDGWEYRQRISHPDGLTSTLFGHSLAADGQRLVVGAPKAHGGTAHSGAAYLYELDGDTWQYKFSFQYPHSYSYERFGFSVGIHGDQVIVGSPNHIFDTSQGPRGTAHIFINAGSTWFHAGTLAGSDIRRNEKFGERVAIRGDFAVVSATRSSHSGQTHAGSIHVFKIENGFWQEKYTLTPHENNVQSYMYFGGAFALSDQHILVGSHLEDNLLNDSGNSYIHRLETTVSTSNPVGKVHGSMSASPNPFDKKTLITFQLASDSDITLTAFDQQGHILQRIVEGLYPAGSNQITWNPHHLAPGTYYIQLKAGGYISTLKVARIH